MIKYLWIPVYLVVLLIGFGQAKDGMIMLDWDMRNAMEQAILFILYGLLLLMNMELKQQRGMIFNSFLFAAIIGAYGNAFGLVIAGLLAMFALGLAFIKINKN